MFNGLSRDGSIPVVCMAVYIIKHYTIADAFRNATKFGRLGLADYSKLLEMPPPLTVERELLDGVAS